MRKGSQRMGRETKNGPHEIMINGQTFGPHDMNFNETLSSELLNLNLE